MVLSEVIEKLLKIKNDLGTDNIPVLTNGNDGEFPNNEIIDVVMIEDGMEAYVVIDFDWPGN